MAKTAIVRASIEPDKKEKVSKILKRLGINHSEAINIFYSLIEEYQGLPFDVRLPNEENGQKSVHTARPEVLSHLKDSIDKNRRLGELLAK
jgi:DNA-damage-inducible protein J